MTVPKSDLTCMRRTWNRYNELLPMLTRLNELEENQQQLEDQHSKGRSKDKKKR